MNTDQGIGTEKTIADRLHIKTYILVVIVVIFGPLGNVLVGKGMKGVGEMTSWAPKALFDFFWRAFTTPTIWLGIASLLAFFVAYMLVLSWADYSFVQPATSVSYAVVALLSIFLLHEIVRPTQWAGRGNYLSWRFYGGKHHAAHDQA